jgi:hypothetical protein
MNSDNITKKDSQDLENFDIFDTRFVSAQAVQL